MGLWKWQCCLIVVLWKWQCFPIVGLNKWQWVQIGGLQNWQCVLIRGPESWQCPDWGAGKLAMSWLRNRKAGNGSWLPAFQSPNQDIASFPAPLSGHIASFSAPNLDSLPLTQAHNWETLPFSWYHNQATLPLSQSHLVRSLKLFLSFFSEEGFDEKFKYCFRSSKSSATSYQKIPNQWRVPLNGA